MCNQNASFIVEDRHQIFFVRRRDDDGWRKICKYFFQQIKTTQRDLLTCMGCGVCLHDNMYWRARKKIKAKPSFNITKGLKSSIFPPRLEGRAEVSLIIARRVNCDTMKSAIWRASNWLRHVSKGSWKSATGFITKKLYLLLLVSKHQST